MPPTQRQEPGTLRFSLAILQHAYENLAVWKAIGGRESGAYVLQRIQEVVADLAAND